MVAHLLHGKRRSGAPLEKLERLQRPGCEKELTIEIDIRTATRENVEYYAELGIQRLSFGIQDFNADVQRLPTVNKRPSVFMKFFRQNCVAFQQL